EQMACELQHVIGAAIFRRAGTELIRKLSRIGLPTLIVAGATVRVGALADHLVPEVVGDLSVVRIAGQFVETGCSDHLWNMCIDMQSLQFIAMAGKRLEESALVEAPRTCEDRKSVV